MKQIIRRNLLLLVAILIISGVTACKKKNSDGPKSVNYTAKMEGKWIGIEPDDPSDFATSGGVFFPFTIVAINDTTILEGDTLVFDPKASTKDIYYFNYSKSKYPNYNRRKTIAFIVNDSSIINDFYYSGGSSYSWYGITVHVESNTYKINPSLKEYIPKITGTHRLSGTYRFLGGYIDSVHSITEDVEFKALDDLTLVCSKEFIEYMDDTLHYKCSNEASKTITFQTYHTKTSRSYIYTASTLVYSYQNDSLYFEQVDATDRQREFVKLFN